MTVYSTTTGLVAAAQPHCSSVSKGRDDLGTALSTHPLWSTSYYCQSIARQCRSAAASTWCGSIESCNIRPASEAADTHHVVLNKCGGLMAFVLANWFLRTYFEVRTLCQRLDTIIRTQYFVRGTSVLRSRSRPTICLWRRTPGAFPAARGTAAPCALKLNWLNPLLSRLIFCQYGFDHEIRGLGCYLTAPTPRSRAASKWL